MIFPGKFIAACALSLAILPLPLLPATAADDLAWPLTDCGLLGPVTLTPVTAK